MIPYTKGFTPEAYTETYTRTYTGAYTETYATNLQLHIYTLCIYTNLQLHTFQCTSPIWQEVVAPQDPVSMPSGTPRPTTKDPGPVSI